MITRPNTSATPTVPSPASKRASATIAPQPANTSAKAASPSAAVRRHSASPWSKGSGDGEHVAPFPGEALVRPLVHDRHHEAAHGRLGVLGQDRVGAGADLLRRAPALELPYEVRQQPHQAELV